MERPLGPSAHKRGRRQRIYLWMAPRDFPVYRFNLFFFFLIPIVVTQNGTEIAGHVRSKPSVGVTGNNFAFLIICIKKIQISVCLSWFLVFFCEVNVVDSILGECLGWLRFGSRAIYSKCLAVNSISSSGHVPQSLLLLRFSFGFILLMRFGVHCHCSGALVTGRVR